MKFIDPEKALEALTLPEPPEITSLKAEIEKDTKLLETVLTTLDSVDETAIEAVVQKKLKLDALYSRWMESL